MSMIAIDTNIIVRLAMRDDETQYQKVIDLLKSHDFYISRTVQLETEWVLRSRYRQPRQEIADFFTLLLQKTKIICESEEELMNTICWYRLGADFADAMHLANVGDKLFYTFDMNFCKNAFKEGITPKIHIL